MENISAHITYKEATKSDTAIRLGIENEPNEYQLSKMKALANTIFEPTRLHFGKPIKVSSFFRSEELNSAVGGSSTSQHCFDEYTEILTKNGWRKSNTISKSDIILNYNNQSGEICEDYIKNIIRYNYSGDMIAINTKNINLYVTDKHRLLCSTTSKRDSMFFENAEDSFGKRRMFISAKEKQGEKDNYLNLHKLCMATIADGCILSKGNGIRFNLKKNRKIKYLEDLFIKMDIDYKKRYCSSREKQGQFGVYEINIYGDIVQKIKDIISNDKIIPNHFLDLNCDDIEDLLKTYAFFDGYFDKRIGCTGFSISTTKKENADILQLMAFFCGLRCGLSYSEIETSFGLSKLYNLSVSDNQLSRANEDSYLKENVVDLPVWCVETNNGTVICRRDGKITICGNCKGEAMDIDNDGSSPTNREIFDYIKDNLVFDQLIFEGGTKEDPDWVHVSKKLEGVNRGQVLRMSYKKGKVIYENYVP